MGCGGLGRISEIIPAGGSFYSVGNSDLERVGEQEGWGRILGCRPPDSTIMRPRSRAAAGTRKAAFSRLPLRQLCGASLTRRC